MGPRILAAALVLAAVVFAPNAHAAEPLLDLRTVWSCDPVAVYLDPAAPPEVVEAVGQWRRAFRPDWQLADHGDVQILMRKPANPDDGGLTTLAATATTRLTAVVEVDPRLDDLGDIARHELGHVAGLGHNEDTQFSAMNPHPLMHRYGAGDLALMRVAGRSCMRGAIRYTGARVDA